jgi:uncharacterized LabA/DUF88 family protein
LTQRQSSDKRFALLIDADNVSAKYIAAILDELSKYGTVTIKRIYGDWTSNLHAKWKDVLLDNSITPIQQFSYTYGKNATDSAMIIDAMDILYTNSVEGFCLVSSDSDFTRLAARLRESGLTVIGMGEKKTPTPFRKACDIFTTLELLLADENAQNDSTGTAQRSRAKSVDSATLPKKKVEQAVVSIITDNQNNGKTTGLGEVGSRLLKRFPDFDVRNYGTNQLKKLLDEFPSVVITKEGNSVTVELAEDSTADAKATEDAPSEAADSTETADADAATDAAAESAPKSRTRRGKRGGRRHRSSRTETAETAAAAEDAEAAEGASAAAEAGADTAAGANAADKEVANAATDASEASDENAPASTAATEGADGEAADEGSAAADVADENAAVTETTDESKVVSAGDGAGAKDADAAGPADAASTAEADDAASSEATIDADAHTATAAEEPAPRATPGRNSSGLRHRPRRRPGKNVRDAQKRAAAKAAAEDAEAAPEQADDEPAPEAVAEADAAAEQPKKAAKKPATGTRRRRTKVSTAKAAGQKAATAEAAESTAEDVAPQDAASSDAAPTPNQAAAPVASEPVRKPARELESATPAAKAAIEDALAKRTPEELTDAAHAYIMGQLALAGDAGVSLPALGKRVRAKLRGFKLRDLGYARFKDFVSSFDDVEVEQRDRTAYAVLKH